MYALRSSCAKNETGLFLFNLFKNKNILLDKTHRHLLLQYNHYKSQCLLVKHLSELIYDIFSSFASLNGDDFELSVTCVFCSQGTETQIHYFSKIEREGLTLFSVCEYRIQNWNLVPFKRL